MTIDFNDPRLREIADHYGLTKIIPLMNRKIDRQLRRIKGDEIDDNRL